MTRARTGTAARTWAILMVLALLGVPLAGLRSNVCDHCPPGCPMHAKHRLPCHRAMASDTMAPRRHVGCVALPGIAKPGCGHGEQLGGFTLPWAVPPALRVGWFLSVRALADCLAPASIGRGSDPPEPPPPILSA